MQNRVLPVERASFPTCMPIFTARIADPRPGRAPDPRRLFYEAEASRRVLCVLLKVLSAQIDSHFCGERPANGKVPSRQQHRARMDTHERRCASAPVYEDLLLATALPCRRRAAELRAARGAHALQCSTFPGRARREAAPALSQQPHRVEPSDLASSHRTRGGEQLDAREPRLDGDGAQL